MAKIKYNSLVSDIRGVVGEQVYDRCKNAGPFVRSRRRTAYRRYTTNQAAATNIFTEGSKVWKTMDIDDKTGWQMIATQE